MSATDDVPMPKMGCPNCIAVYDDFDGFGVLFCGVCGYCTHPSVTGGVCDWCKKKRPPRLPEKKDP